LSLYGANHLGGILAVAGTTLFLTTINGISGPTYFKILRTDNTTPRALLRFTSAHSQICFEFTFLDTRAAGAALHGRVAAANHTLAINAAFALFRVAAISIAASFAYTAYILTSGIVTASMSSRVIARTVTALFVRPVAADIAVGVKIFALVVSVGKTFVTVSGTALFTLACIPITVFATKIIAASFIRIFKATVQQITAIEYAFTAFRAVTTAAAMWPAAAPAAQCQITKN
jgi:hypothetical protein